MEASYLAGKLSWTADYVLTVARDDKSADLDGWVTVANGSGTSFKNAKLQLVAGDLNRVRQVVGRMEDAHCARAWPRRGCGVDGAGGISPITTSTPSPERPRSTTTRRSRSACLAPPAFPVQKRYVVDGQDFYYRNVQHPGAPLKDVVQVYYQFKNEETAGLGMPMPSGTVRVYQADSAAACSSWARTGSITHRRTKLIKSQDRQRVRRGVRAQADRLPAV